MKYTLYLIVIIVFLISANEVFSQTQYSGNPIENYPLWVTKLTSFGQRADWSHDEKKVLFIEKTHVDVFEKLKTRKTWHTNIAL